MIITNLRSAILPLSLLSLSLSVSPSLLANTQPELLQNGSFEEYTATKDRTRWKLAQLHHWQGDGEVWTNQIGRTATSGDHKVELDVGSEVNSLSQDFTTQANQKYQLSLDAYARRTNSSDFEILIDGEVIATIKPDRRWQSYRVFFLGNGGTQTLTLRELANQSNGLGTIIDNVSLTASNELLNNGSFEDFSVTQDNGRWKLVNFTDWEGAGEVWNNRIGKRSQEGNFKAELDVARNADSLTQTVNTQDRFIYQISLDAYARRKNSSDFELWVDDQHIQTIKPTRQWARYSATFTGNGSAQRISIRELAAQNNGHGTIIDNVSLVDTGLRENVPPTLSGTPEKYVNVGESYTFKPEISDPDIGDTLHFAITNQPAWASFDTATGTLSGVPTEKSTDQDIQISVTDGVATVELPAFTIKALEVVNIAQRFGEATQGGTYRSEFASRAIDGDAGTYNHTSCSADQNWWQVKLPAPTLISKFTIQSRSDRTDRISNAKVYVSDTPYSDGIKESDLVATLSSVRGAQETQFDNALSGNYLIVKAAGSQCLHMEEVEVYGRMPETPHLAAHQQSYLVAGNTEVGTPLATLEASDYQSDALVYAIVGDSPFNINAQGVVGVAETLAAGRYEVIVKVSDGEHSTQSTLTINVTSETAVEDALGSGDARQVTAKELIPAALAEIERLREGPASLGTIYGEEAIEYNPGNRTQLINLTAEPDQAWPLIQGAKGKTLAAAGLTSNSRFAAFGSVPMEYFQNSANLSYEPQFKRLLAWLLSGEKFTENDLAEPRTVALSYASGDARYVRDWIAANFENWTLTECSDANTLSSCYASADLIITGWQGSNEDADTIVQALGSSADQGTPILYLHTWYEDYNNIAHGIAGLLGFQLPYGGNYWAKDAADWATASDMQTAINQDKGYDAFVRLLNHFANDDYSIDLASCNSACSNIEAYDSEFAEAAGMLQNTLQPLDQSNTDLFAESSYRLEKLLILLGDKYRQQVNFPMDKTNSDANQFLKSLFADYSTYNSRQTNPAQADMGNFSRSDFSHITPVNKTVDLESKRNFRAAGVYALPGQTVEITRTDSSDVNTRVFINTQRSGSTHLFEKNGYKRPKFLKSNLVNIKPGQTIKLTSPYGGPVQVTFDKNDLPVSFTFNNVGEHPFWSGTDDNERFAQQLAAGDYDWAELVTPGFEVHSTLEKMRTSMNDSRWGNAAALANATMRYMHNLPHALAGFQGPGIDPIPELHEFAETNGWTMRTLDKVQHMNADQATCGYGCSGNPYDAYWAYSPIGHGDVHELGHGLQGGKRFAGWQNHTMTNYYSYFTKSNYYKDTGGEPGCQSLPFERMFNVLQAGANASDSAAYIKTNLWDKMGWSEGAGMFIQMMMAAQKDGALNDGWLLRGRLHMLEREYDQAKSNETLWNEKRDSLGFGQYSLSDVKSISTNDWYLIAISYATGRNFSDYFDMWAMPYSATAKAQVSALNYPMMPKRYFKSEANAYCYGLDKAAITIDGKQTW